MAYRKGIGEVDAQLAAASAAVARDEQLTRMAAAAAADIDTLSAELAVHDEVLSKDRDKVASLEGSSMAALFYKLLGKKDDKLVERKDSLLGSLLRHQLIEAELIAVEEQSAEIERQRAPLADAAEQLARARSDKEAWLVAHAGPGGEHLFKLAEEAGRHQAILREISEAHHIGVQALGLIDEVIGLLRSAGNWGTFDMFGGGLLATVVKHGKIDAARDKQNQAQAALVAFSRELRDVEIQLEASIEIEGFSKFGDFFFDGLIFDWTVQSKIKRSREAVEQTRADVVKSLTTLDSQRETLAGRVAEMAAQRQHYIDSWGR